MIWIHVNKAIFALGIVLISIQIGDYPIGKVIGGIVIVIEFLTARRMSEELTHIPNELIKKYYKSDRSRIFFSRKDRIQGILNLYSLNEEIDDRNAQQDDAGSGPHNG